MAESRSVQDSVTAKVTHDVTVAVAKISPAGAAMMFGYSLNEWVAIATLVYIALQAFHLCWKWSSEWRAARKGAP